MKTEIAATPCADTNACPICCETFTSKVRAAVTCNYCQNSACTVCSKRYLLSTSMDPHCMHCRVAWNPEYIDTTFTPFFRTGQLRKHRQQVLLDREKHHLPEAQPLAELERKHRILRNMITPLDKQLIELQGLWRDAIRRAHELRTRFEGMQRMQYRPCTRQDRTAAYDPVVRQEELTEAQEVVLQYRHDIERAEHHRRAVNEATRRDLGLDVAVPRGPRQRSHYVRPCTTPDCRGFLNREWKCELCKHQTCRECHENVGIPELQAESHPQDAISSPPSHVCKPENVETAKMLERDTKHCPKCSVPIFRIDGCNQMFCTQCHAAFDWATGKLEEGRIHNPHYYDWLRARSATGEIRREEGDADHDADPDPCAGHPNHLPTARVMATLLHASWNTTPLHDMHRLVSHIRDVNLQHLALELEHSAELTEELRVHYLLKDIDEETWMRRLYLFEKKQQRLLAMRAFFETVSAVAGDLVRQAIDVSTRLRMETNEEANFFVAEVYNESLTMTVKMTDDEMRKRVHEKQNERMRTKLEPEIAAWKAMMQEALAFLNRTSDCLSLRFNTIKMPLLDGRWRTIKRESEKKKTEARE